MLWLAVDLLIALGAVFALVVVTLGLWRRLKALKGHVGELSGLAAQASEAVATIQR